MDQTPKQFNRRDAYQNLQHCFVSNKAIYEIIFHGRNIKQKEKDSAFIG